MLRTHGHRHAWRPLPQEITRGDVRVCCSQLDLVKLAEGERATLQHEIDGYRAEAQEQQKVRLGLHRFVEHWLRHPVPGGCNPTRHCWVPASFGHQQMGGRAALYANRWCCNRGCRQFLCHTQAIQQLEQERDKYASNAARANAAHAAAVADAEAKAVSLWQSACAGAVTMASKEAQGCYLFGTMSPLQPSSHHISLLTLTACRVACGSWVYTVVTRVYVT